MDENEYAEIKNISEEECCDRWQGVDWIASKENPQVGLCVSDYDFDAWIAEHEAKENENHGS